MPWLPLLARHGGLTCAGGKTFPCATADGGHDLSVCARHAQTVDGVAWPTCPTRAVIDSPDVHAVLHLERQLSVGPLRDWPRGYPARTARALPVLLAERRKAAVQLAKLDLAED